MPKSESTPHYTVAKPKRASVSAMPFTTAAGHQAAAPGGDIAAYAAIVVVASVDAYTCSSYIALRRTAAVPLLRRQLPAALEEIRAPTRPATQGKAKQIIECDWIEE